MRHSSRHRFGFCWLNLLFGILLLAVMIALGLPGVRRDFDEAQRDAVEKNLMRIVAAKQRYQVAHDSPAGTPVTLEQLIEQGEMLTAAPDFPDLSKLEIGPIGAPPRYTLQGEVIVGDAATLKQKNILRDGQ